MVQSYASDKAKQLVSKARNNATRGLSSIVNQHMGNNQQSRALANALKKHISNGINAAHASTQTKISGLT